MAKPKILIVDDERPTRDAMARALGRSYDCLTAPDAELALKALAENSDIAALITDYKMPGDNGITLIRKAKALNPSLGAILITAFGEIDLAVEAMKQGANDFLTKPITDLNKLDITVSQVIQTPAIGDTTNSATDKHGNFQDFTGSSPAMERLYALIKKVAPTDATVLIGGPSGSGKELAARALHKLSKRADKPFIAIECSAFSGDLLKSELFGYEPGTFTGGLKDGKAGCFEEADGGTLFLDEIGEIDMPTQIALLRTLETKSVRRIGGTREKKVDFRLVAATNKNLPAMVVEKTFREDLFYRLNVIGLTMPPLKDHAEDITPIVHRFIREFSEANGSRVTDIDAQTLDALKRYPWPGNVRQLRNVIERMVVLATGSVLTQADLPDEIAHPIAPPACGSDVIPPMPTIETGSMSHGQENPTQSLAATEKDQILNALKACHGNKSKAADMLGISRRTIHRKLNEWNIE